MIGTSAIVLGELLEGPRSAERERSDRRTTQRGQVSAGPEPRAEVAGDRADVGAAGAPDRHVEVDAALGLADLVHLDRVDPDRARLQLELLTGARQLVGAPAADLDRRDGRGHLVDRAHEARPAR